MPFTSSLWRALTISKHTNKHTNKQTEEDDDLSILESKLNHFIEAVRKGLYEKNFYASLTVALTLPDICSKIEFPEENTGKRYPEWFDKYVGDKYKVNIIGQEICFLVGQDAYALRCALLHQGEIDITSQRARSQLSKFVFVEPPRSGMIHNNKINNMLQLQVDIFCLDICEGVEKWIEENKTNTVFDSRLTNMIEIKKNITSL